jgi:DNA-directed RNA polymerase subunit RPC12/RpoP
MKLYRTLALAAVLSIGVAGGSFAASKPKPAAKTTTAPATQYECAHCNIKMSAKEAKANGMKCTACGAKLTMVKKPAKSTSKTKKA